MTRLRLGLLGCGGIGARHLAAAGKLPDDFEVVACCGRDTARTAAFAAERGLIPFIDLDRMLDAARLDVLVIATPPDRTGVEVEAAARAGVHLMVEKPIALDLDAAARMTAAVAAARVTASVGFMYRYGDAVRRWQALDTGPLGVFSGSYHCNALHAPWWRERARSGGQLLEQAIHLIDLVRVFMGEPDTVYARAANLFHRDTPGYDIEDVSGVVFGWDDDRLATLTASNIAVPGRWQKGWQLAARDWSARFDDWNKAVLTRTRPDVVDEAVEGVTDPFVAQLADLAAAIRERRETRAPLREGEATLRLALAARRSADLRAEVRLADAI